MVTKPIQKEDARIKSIYRVDIKEPKDIKKILIWREKSTVTLQYSTFIMHRTSKQKISKTTTTTPAQLKRS